MFYNLQLIFKIKVKTWSKIKFEYITEEYMQD